MITKNTVLSHFLFFTLLYVRRSYKREGGCRNIALLGYRSPGYIALDIRSPIAIIIVIIAITIMMHHHHHRLYTECIGILELFWTAENVDEMVGDHLTICDSCCQNSSRWENFWQPSQLQKDPRSYKFTANLPLLCGDGRFYWTASIPRSDIGNSKRGYLL